MMLRRCLQALGKLRIRDAGEVSFARKQRLLVRSIEARAVNGAGKIGYEHTAALDIQRQTNPFHQAGEDNLWILAFPRLRIQGRAVHSVAAWWVSAIRPVDHSIGQIEIEVDGFRQTIKQEFNVLAICRTLVLRNFQIRSKDA